MSEVKAITTYYNGYKFRSRLEARWAVFFDAAGIRYEYEPEGLKLPNGLCYLPDFYLPDEKIYVEIKPPRKDAWKDISKACKFVGNGIDCLLILPNIPDNTACIWFFPVLYWNPVEQSVLARWIPFIPVKDIGAVLMRNHYDPTKLTDRFIPAFDWVSQSVSERAVNNLLTPKIDETYKIQKQIGNIQAGNYEMCMADEEREFMHSLWDKARQARFEHGEKG